MGINICFAECYIQHFRFAAFQVFYSLEIGYYIIAMTVIQRDAGRSLHFMQQELCTGKSGISQRIMCSYYRKPGSWFIQNTVKSNPGSERCDPVMEWRLLLKKIQ